MPCKIDKYYKVPDSVTTIGNYAFSSCSSLTAVTLSNNIKSIGYYAFINCHSLTSIYIPDNVNLIGEAAFIGCSKLSKIEVSNQNQNYKSIDGVLFTKDERALLCYPQCKIDSKYVVSNKVKKINKYAFFNCNYLTSLTILNNETEIESEGIYRKDSLKFITIPNGVLSSISNGINNKSSLSITVVYNDVIYPIDGYELKFLIKTIFIDENASFISVDALLSFNYLKRIEVSPKNQKFKSIDGVLFSKNGEILIYYPPFMNGSSYEIPYGVSIIEILPSMYCYSLQSIIIPGTVKCIKKYAFGNNHKFSITYYGESDPKFDESSYVKYRYCDKIEVFVPLTYLDKSFCSLCLLKKDPKIKAQTTKCIDISVFNKTENGIINVNLDKEKYERKANYNISITNNIKEILVTLINEVSLTLLLHPECEEITIHTQGYVTVPFIIIPQSKKVTINFDKSVNVSILDIIDEVVLNCKKNRMSINSISSKSKKFRIVPKVPITIQKVEISDIQIMNVHSTNNTNCIINDLVICENASLTLSNVVLKGVSIHETANLIVNKNVDLSSSSIIIKNTDTSFPFSKYVSGELSTVPENIGFNKYKIPYRRIVFAESNSTDFNCKEWENVLNWEYPISKKGMIRYRCVNESGITRLQNFKDNDTEMDPYYYTEIQ